MLSADERPSYVGVPHDKKISCHNLFNGTQRSAETQPCEGNTASHSAERLPACLGIPLTTAAGSATEGPVTGSARKWSVYAVKEWRCGLWGGVHGTVVFSTSSHPRILAHEVSYHCLFCYRVVCLGQ